jgi:hypothetical protein
MITLCHQLLIEFHEEKGLVLDIGEEVIIADQLKNVWPAKPKKVRQCFARLPVLDVPRRD